MGAAAMEFPGDLLLVTFGKQIPKPMRGDGATKRKGWVSFENEQCAKNTLPMANRFAGELSQFGIIRIVLVHDRPADFGIVAEWNLKLGVGF